LKKLTAFFKSGFFETSGFMNKAIRLAGASTFLLTSLLSVAQTRSADTIVHRTFAALKAQDKSAFIALFPAYEPFKKFLLQTMLAEKQRRMGDTLLPVDVDSLEVEFINNLTEADYVNDMVPNFSTPFQKALEQGMEKGLNWSNAMLTNYTLTKTPTAGDVPAMEGIMDIRDGTQEYQLAFDQIIWFEPEQSWFGINQKNWYAMVSLGKKALRYRIACKWGLTQQL
jgi:hypothetical protein